MTEIDYHARLAWLQERRNDGLVSWLEGDPENYDAKAAGWWLYVLAAGIGDPFDSGPWVIHEGRLVHRKHLGDAGQGVNRELPHLGDAGQGEYEALAHYLTRLATRLRRVRITCGDYRRVLQSSSVIRAKTGGDGTIGVFLDPPYATSGDVYAHGDSEGTISAAVRAWCASAPRDLRIVLCGYDDEHDELIAAGWVRKDGKAGGGAGYATNPRNGRREGLWLSPACRVAVQGSLL